MKQLDVLLVLGYFRSAAAYLSIIKHLSPHLRVGLLPAAVDPSYLAKTPEAQALFLDLCRKFGAEIVEQGTPVRARLLIVQQFPYPEETATTIRNTVQAAHVAGSMALALAGLPKQDAFLKQFGVSTIFVPNRRLFRFLVERRDAQAIYRDVDVIQVGLPFGKYPVFPEFSADYVVAAPTAFSFHKEAHKHEFFAAVLKLLRQIPSSQTVVYKAHNGTARDYFTPRAYAAPGALLARIPGAAPLVGALMRRAPRAAAARLEKLYTSILFERVLARATPLSAFTPYSDFALEAFLPNVRRGVIGGLSNTIWGTLFYGQTFYNCANEEERAKAGRNELLPHKDSSNYLDLNLQFFSVPCCEGDLARGSRGEAIVTAEDRQGDLMQAIQALVEPAKAWAVE